MTGLRLQVSEKIERKFREVAMKKYGYGKGALSKAAEEALQRWISVEQAFSEFEGDPVEAVDGIIEDLKLHSVRLQHSATKTWASKVLKNVSH